jgi:predicted transcriptional regulator
MYKRLLTIRINKEKYLKLEETAKRSETSVSSVIRQAINQFLLEN